MSDEEVRDYMMSKYKDEDIVRIVNPKQCYFYMTKGVYPLYTVAGYNDKIVFVFLKEPTLKLFNEWRKTWNNK